MNTKSGQLIFFRLSITICLLLLVAGQPASGMAGSSETAAISPQETLVPLKPAVEPGLIPARIAATEVLGAMALAVSGDHACALVPGGGLVCWGHNANGELGDGTTTNRNTPVGVVGLDQGVIAVALGHDHTCALVAGGGVKCWGLNGYGRLGDGTTDDSSTPVDVVGLEQGATAIAAGSEHTCALVSGGAKCWGVNSSGQLGEGTLIGHLTPVDVVGLSSGVTAITAGAFHTCAIVSGSARCWGDNYHGELGDGTTTDRYTPVDVVGLEQGVTAIAAGSDSTCALVSGGVKCWGLNDNGQIGDGTTTNRHTPADVAGLEQGATAVAAGFRHTCALVTGGGARCWGLNGAGQLGNGTTTSSNTPVDVFGLSQGVTAIAPGFQHTCAIYSGAVLCWGNYENGALGDGTITTHSIPFDVTELGSSIDAIAVGLEHTCVLVSGGVRCRGVNYDGQLGDGTMNDSSTLVSVIGLEQGVSAIAAGSAHTCALVSGGVKCWGYNYSGQLGDGTITSSSTPVDVVGLSSGVNAITARGEHTCALVSGGVQCWGYNLYGQLGDGTNTDSNTPVEVVGLSSGVSAVAAGDFHTCALVPGGGVQCWGYNYFGELGDGTNTDSNTPVDVVGLDTGVTVVSPGSAHTCALVSGGVKCWGQNQAGALGDGTNTDSNTPVDVIGLDSDATSVFAGGYHTCALVAGGGLKCWGDNLYGQLGDGTFTSSSTPENVAGMAQGVSAVVAGYLNNCALVGAGRAKCWGLTTYGWLGLGWRSQRLTPGYVVESLHPMLAVNYSIGQAGSFFTITGWNFPPSTQGSLSINDQAITNTLAVNPTCSFIFFLDSTGAEPGGYAVTVSVNPGDALSRPAGSQVQAESDTASTGFFLANAAPLRLQEGGGLVFSIPSGMALHNFVYLPVLVR